jgi:hypothetical protein
LIVGRCGEQVFAVDERALCIADTKLSGNQKIQRCRVVGVRTQRAFGERERGGGIEFERGESCAHEQRGRGMWLCGFRLQTRIRGARITRALQHGGFRGEQRVVAVKRLQCFIEHRGRLRLIARAHPDQPREAVLRIDVARLLQHAIAQRGFGAVELAKCDQAARMRVVHGGVAMSGGECVLRSAFGIGRLVRRIECDGERVYGERIARCGEPLIIAHRFVGAPERGECGNLLRDKFRIGVSRGAERRENVERFLRPMSVVAVTRKH